MRRKSCRIYSNGDDRLSSISFPFGWGELWGVADRTNFDLKAHHAKQSGQDLGPIPDPITNEKYDALCHRAVPRRRPRGAGASCAKLTMRRTLENGDTARSSCICHPALAPYKCCCAAAAEEQAAATRPREIYDMLSKHFMVDYDETGSIGKRYRRQDEIGTPMCITVDFDTLETGVVTVRDRDTMEQDHVHVDELVAYIQKKIEY